MCVCVCVCVCVFAPWVIGVSLFTFGWLDCCGVVVLLLLLLLFAIASCAGERSTDCVRGPLEDPTLGQTDAWKERYDATCMFMFSITIVCGVPLCCYYGLFTIVVLVVLRLHLLLLLLLL